MIFEQDIQKERRQKWHTAEGMRPLRTLDDAREFLNSVGFCLAYPVKPAALAPTFIGAYIGSEEKLPTARQAFADDNARAATEFVVRLLSEKSAFEVAFGQDGSLLVSAAEFPYFYALLGDRNPKAAPSPGLRNEQALTTHTFEVIDQHGPINEDDMRRRLGREISRNAIEKVLHGLWSKLRITRVDPGIENGEPVEPVWDLMHRWAPDHLHRGKQISAAEALSALISKYLETVVVAEQRAVEDFFGHLVPRSKVTEVCKALLAAQEFTYEQVSGKTMLRLASRGIGEETAPAPTLPAERKVRPWQARESGKKAAEEKRMRFAQRPPNAFQKFSKDRPSKPFADKKPFADRPRFGADRPPREGGVSLGFKKPFRERQPDSVKPFGERKSFADRPDVSGKKHFGGKNRPSHGRERFGKASGAGFEPRRVDNPPDGKRPFKKDYPPRRREGAESKTGFKKDYPRRGDRPGKSFGDKKPFGKFSSERKSFGKSFSGRSSFDQKRTSGARKPASGTRPPWLKEKKPPREGPTE